MKCEYTIEYENRIIKNDINIRASIYVSQHVSNMNGRFNTNKILEKNERDRYPCFNLSFVMSRSSMNAIIPHTKSVSVRTSMNNTQHLWQIIYVYFSSSGARTLHNVVDNECAKWLNAVCAVYFLGFWHRMLFS